ncbi:hypothetical protein CM318V1_650016 [Carnobacterium maltaromaticum]|nr:hypothetical protein CM318V1_650016 [Carnobacterium maltaromaticum]
MKFNVGRINGSVKYPLDKISHTGKPSYEFTYEGLLYFTVIIKLSSQKESNQCSRIRG